MKITLERTKNEAYEITNEPANDNKVQVASPTQPPVLQPVEPVTLHLTKGVNAKQYRKKVFVYAFQVDSPVTIDKSWGRSSCGVGDWLLISGTSDAYTVPHSEFIHTYEPVPHGVAHTFHKKAKVLAAQVATPFTWRTGTIENEKLLTVRVGEFIVQDEQKNQYVVDERAFQATYELVAQLTSPALSTDALAIRALQGRRVSHAVMPNADGVILPNSLFWRVWTTAMVAVILYNIFMLPFRLAFDFHSTNAAYLVLDYVGDTILIIDVILRFRLAFECEGMLIVDRSVIRERYMRSSFLFDCIACIPLDFIMIGIGMQPLLRLGRLIKIGHSITKTTNMEKRQ